MNPQWSRYAARLKHTQTVHRAIIADARMLGRVTSAMAAAESLESVQDEEIRRLLQRAASEIAAGRASSPERAFCDAARAYLLGFPGVTSEILERYLEPTDRRAAKLSDVYWQLLWSAQNANMRTTVVTGSMEGGMMALSNILFGFEPSAVAAHYGDDSERVLDDIVEKVRPRGQVRRSKRSIWPLFSRSITSGAKFLLQFADAEAFYAWAEGFDNEGGSRSELPAFISQQVFGLGFALSCDFLKELGLSNYGKPDVHIKKILAGLGVTSSSADDAEVLNAVCAFAEAAGVSPYHADKLMWLIGSGYFYWHPEIGHVDTERDEFVASQAYLFVRSA